MATYVIGDVQGCFKELEGLLKLIHFEAKQDSLWFAGDLVNRGPQSLATLRFVKSLPNAAVVLGNHDLHLIAAHYGLKTLYPDDTIQDILNASDREELIHWLRHQKLIHYDASFDVLMVHAGVAPQWDRSQALSLASEVEATLKSEDIQSFLKNMYGNEPDYWHNDLTGFDRLRVITNYLTRMRFCDKNGRLLMSKKTSPLDCPPGYMPWFKVPNRKMPAQTIAFGHWSSLLGETGIANVFALDTGVVWGGALTALRLDDFKHFSFSVK